MSAATLCCLTTPMQKNNEMSSYTVPLHTLNVSDKAILNRFRHTKYTWLGLEKDHVGFCSVATTNMSGHCSDVSLKIVFFDTGLWFV